MKLKNKVALVTGSGHGLGRGIAKVLASEGAKVIVNSRKAEDLVTCTASGHEVVVAAGPLR